MPVSSGASRASATGSAATAGQAARKRAHSPGVADGEHEAGAGEAVGHRLAQRPRRHHPAVAEAEAGVDDDDRKVLGEAGVLQAVVHDDRLRAGGNRRPRRRRPVAPDPDRREGGEEQRLVADLLRPVPPLVDPHRLAAAPGEAPPVPARHHLRIDAAGGEPHEQRDHRRGLARAAGGQVADADHRHADPRRGAARQPPPGDRGPQRRQRCEQPRREPRPCRRVAPEAWRPHQALRSRQAPIAAITVSVTAAPSLTTSHAAEAISAARSGAIVATRASASSSSLRTSAAAPAIASRR